MGSRGPGAASGQCPLSPAAQVAACSRPEREPRPEVPRNDLVRHRRSLCGRTREDVPGLHHRTIPSRLGVGSGVLRAAVTACEHGAMASVNLDLGRYYRDRADEYDEVYAKPERQADIAVLKSLLPELVARVSV